MGNMNCSGQKANSKEYDENYNKIFKDMQSIEDKIEMKYCKLCGVPLTEMTEFEFKTYWNSMCNKCGFKLVGKED